MKMAKQLLDESLIEKVKSIEDSAEMEQALKYLLISHLEKIQDKIENKISELEAKGANVFHVRNHFALFPSKIKHFQVAFDEKEFEKIYMLFKKIKSELKDVAI